MPVKKIPTEQALESLIADTTLAALDAKKRGEPVPEGFAEEDLRQLEMLTAPATPAEDKQRTDALLKALGSDRPSQKEAEEPKGLKALWERWRLWLLSGALIPATAAGALAALMPLNSAPGALALRELSRSAPALADGGDIVERSLALDQCANVRLGLSPEAAAVSGSLSAEAYLLQGKQIIPWKLSMDRVHANTLGTLRCTDLPRGATPGQWELLILVGYPGRLWWSRDAVLQASEPTSGSSSGSLRGVLYVRQPLEILPPATSPKT